MPYTMNTVPEAIKKLPKHAQEIYVAAFNNAYKEYSGDEGRANATAWAAIKQEYKKKGDEWVPKANKESTGISAQNKRDMLQTALRTKFPSPDGLSPWIQDVWDDDFVYSVKDTNFKIPYTIDENGKVTLGEPIKVVQKTEFVPTTEAKKTEDGSEFPASAYAYVPDSAQPSTWKLRLWEDPTKKITKSQLGRAAAALSPGGFRGNKVEIPSEDLSVVKRKIRSAYRSLDVSDEEMPKWVKESMTREVISNFIGLSEAKVDSKGTAHLTIIKPGFNEGKGRYYPKEMLARDYGIFEGVKMYADHPTENDETQRPERSIKDWVATLTNVKVNEAGEVEGQATIVEPWLKEKLSLLKDKGMLSDMGVSINAIGAATDAEIEGVKTKMVEKLIRARSVDFVTEAGAGGKVNLYESIDNDIDLIDLAALKELRPDLVSAIESELAPRIQKEVKQKMEAEQKVTELEGQVASLTTERDGLKAQVEESTKAKAKDEAQAKISEAVDKADLPEASKKRLMESFKEATTAEGIDEAITAEVNYVATITEAGKVKGMGGTQPDPEANRKALIESAKKLHPEWTDEQCKTFAEGR